MARLFLNIIDTDVSPAPGGSFETWAFALRRDWLPGRFLGGPTFGVTACLLPRNDRPSTVSPTATLYCTQPQATAAQSRVPTRGNVPQLLEVRTDEFAARGIVVDPYPPNTAVTSSAGSYRVGITLTNQTDDPAVPSGNLGAAAGELVSVRATATTPAWAGRESVVLQRFTPLNLKADGSGTVWITLPIENRLSFPRLLLAFPKVPTQPATDSATYVPEKLLELNLDDAIKKYLKTVTTQQLQSAVDPRTQTQVLPRPDDAEAVASGIRAVMATKPSSPGLRSAGLPWIKVTPPEPVTSVFGRELWPPGGPQPPQAGPAQQAHLAVQSAAAQANDCWCFSVAGVGLGCSFMKMTPEEAAGKRQQMLDECGHSTSAAVEPMGFFDFDWVGDIAGDIWDGIVQVTTILADDLTVAFTVIVGGVKKFFEGAWDVIETVMDAVAWVINAAGAALGTAVGWLLEQLGFLFDWKAIKAKRDELRILISSRLSAVLAALPDPRVACTSLSNRLDAIQQDATKYLQRFSSSPAVSTKFGNYPAPALANLLPSPGGSSMMPQATWFLDKAMSLLPVSALGPGVPQIPGLEDALTGLVRTLDETIVSGMDRALEDLWEVVQKLFSEGSLTSSNLDPVIDFVISFLNITFGAIKAIISAAGKILYAMATNSGKIVDWLDQELPLGFFASFYRALTGNTLSIFDLTCMVAAIPAYIIDKPSGKSARAMAVAADDDKLKTASTALHITNTVVSTLGAFTTAILPKPPDDNNVQWWSYADYFFTGMTVTSSVAAEIRKVSETEGPGVAADATILVFAAATIGGLSYMYRQHRGYQPSQSKGGIAVYAQGAYAFYSVTRLAVDAARGASANAIVYQIETLIGTLSAIVVRYKRPLDEYTAGLYALLQCLISLIKLGLNEGWSFLPPPST